MDEAFTPLVLGREGGSFRDSGHARATLIGPLGNEPSHEPETAIILEQWRQEMVEFVIEVDDSRPTSNPISVRLSQWGQMTVIDATVSPFTHQ